jgi:DNA-directed RNA polymerase specialized sigma24 family protein
MITEQVITIVEDSKWPEDEKQDFYVYILENKLKLEGTDREVRRQVNRYMAFRKQNQNWTENNRKRLLEENEQLVRDIYTNYDDYADGPDKVIEAEEVLDEFMNNLSDVNRHTFQRIFLDGLMPEELAEEEGVARNAIDQRVHNIKKQIQGEV